MKIKIDQEDCIEYGSSEQACSEAFVVESGEKASIVKKFQTKNLAEGEIGDDLSGCVQDAADGCPVDVISLT